MQTFYNLVSASTMLILVLFYNTPASSAQSLNSRVLLVFNGNSPESENVANYYAMRRGIPADNLLRIEPSNQEEVSYSEFTSGIRNPILGKLNQHDGTGTLYKDKILYIVFSYRTPYRITNAPSSGGQGYSLDQYVANIHDGSNSKHNPYFAESFTKSNIYQLFLSLEQFRSQHFSNNPIYSVWRLDAPSADIAKGLVDKAIAAETHRLQEKGLA